MSDALEGELIIYDSDSSVGCVGNNNLYAHGSQISITGSSSIGSLSDDIYDFDQIENIAVTGPDGYIRSLSKDKLILAVTKSILKQLSIKKEELPRHINSEDPVTQEVTRARLAGEIDL